MRTLENRWAAPSMLALSLAVSLLVALSPASAQERVSDEITPKNLMKERRVLDYDQLHEKDVMYEKRIWRQINVDEKRNHIFRNEKRPFINILLEAVRSGEVAAYGTGNDEFRDRLSLEEARCLGVKHDTIEVIDPLDFTVRLVPIMDELNPADVKKYRVKEVFFFDEETGTMGVRILGIAPIVKRTNEVGDVIFEGPMFWAYYPDLRKVLSREAAFNAGNDATARSWEDIFEARDFASIITKESNIYDRRIQDYLAGTGALIEGENIKLTIQNMESDMWEP